MYSFTQSWYTNSKVNNKQTRLIQYLLEYYQFGMKENINTWWLSNVCYIRNFSLTHVQWSMTSFFVKHQRSNKSSPNEMEVVFYIGIRLLSKSTKSTYSIYSNLVRNFLTDKSYSSHHFSWKLGYARHRSWNHLIIHKSSKGRVQSGWDEWFSWGASRTIFSSRRAWWHFI